MRIPKVIENIIEDYKYQIDIHMKKIKVFNQIKSLERYEISLCKYCRCVRVKCELFNDSTNCNHDFYLAKPLYVIRSQKILRQNVFNFYCRDCNDYGFFFSHLHYH